MIPPDNKEFVPKWLAGREWLRDTRKAPRGGALARRGETVGRRVVLWYHDAGRSFPWRAKRAGVYERILVEVLLQQTSATTVAVNYNSILRRFPSWETLAAARIQTLESTLKPLGLWRRRARVLQALSRAVLKVNGVLPRDRGELERLPGVGQYVASAILIFQHGLSEPLLDVNMTRVLERYFGIRTRADYRDDVFLQDAARACIQNLNPAIVNWALLDLGSLVCKPRAPLCHICPISRGCHYADNRVVKRAYGTAKRRQSVRFDRSDSRRTLM